MQTTKNLINNVSEASLMIKRNHQYGPGMLLLFMFIGSAHLMAAPGAKSGGPPPVPVVIVEALQVSLAPRVWYAGAVISLNDARLAAEVEGKVEWIAEVGTVVNKGDELVHLDELFIRQQLLEQEAVVEREQARLIFFKKEVSRLKSLASQNSTAERQLDQAIADRSVSQSELNAAHARLSQAREQLKRSRVRAPFAGVVSERFKHVGEWVDSGKEVVRLVNPQRVEIQTRVPVHSLENIAVDSELQLLAGERQDTARIQSIVPVGDDRSRLYELRLVPTSEQWSVGQTVRVAVPTAKAREVIAIPRDALVLRRDGTRVFRIKEDNSAEPLTVTTGIASGDLIEVKGGIQAGDKVVTRGGERLRPGQQVMILNETQSKEQP
ncbi:MAG: efflux RND transporter periplasmic adaptor subunit [Gammaproteobacteria bacterium]|nr:efflux RND transporter periplasmic adaptor subunit [Gammaproteobacteria bacterium]